MLLRFLSSLFFASGIVLTAQANTQPYPDSDSSDGYDTGFYAEAYSVGYDSAPAPAGESASRPVFPTQSYFELLGPMDSRNGRGSVDIQNNDGFELVQDVQRFLEFFFYGGLASELV